MSARYLYYQIHQRFYDDFSVFRAKGVRSQGCFTYKVYKGHRKFVLPVFASDKNIKVVDHNSIARIAEKTEKDAMPRLTALISKVRHLKGLLKKLLFEGYENRKIVSGLANNLDLLDGILLDYRHNVQQKLLQEFQKSYKDDDGYHSYPLTAADIEKIIKLMVRLQNDFKNSIDQMDKTYHYHPGGKKEVTLWGEFNAHMPIVRSECRKLFQAYEYINYLCRAWLPVRTLHEKQEILN